MKTDGQPAIVRKDGCARDAMKYAAVRIVERCFPSGVDCRKPSRGLPQNSPSRGLLR